MPETPAKARSLLALLAACAAQDLLFPPDIQDKTNSPPPPLLMRETNIARVWFGEHVFGFQA